MIREKEARFSVVDIVPILEAQVKIQQEFVEFKKRTTQEMDALREENARLKRRVHVEVMTSKENEKKIHDNM